jgi:hypothetical protein
MAPGIILIAIIIVVATTLQIAGLVFIAFQVRKMNDKMIVDDTAFLSSGPPGSTNNARDARVIAHSILIALSQPFLKISRIWV